MPNVVVSMSLREVLALGEGTTFEQVVRRAKSRHVAVENARFVPKIVLKSVIFSDKGRDSVGNHALGKGTQNDVLYRFRRNFVRNSIGE